MLKSLDYHKKNYGNVFFQNFGKIKFLGGIGGHVGFQDIF